MLLQKNQTIQIQIESISNDGNGVAHYDGMAVFVPFTTIGDEIDAKIVKVCKSYAFGVIEKINASGNGRIQKDCENFPQCGGCNFRHMGYSQELAAKQQFVADAFARIGKIDLKPLDILSSPSEHRYRNKVQYPVTKTANGNVVCGFYAGRSHRIIPCQDCLLQPKHLNNILQSTCKILTQLAISIYNEDTHTGLVRHIYLRDGVNSGEVLLCIVINGTSLPNKKAFVEKITTDYPEISTIVLNINKQKTNVITGNVCKTIFGNGNINDTLCDVPVKLNPLSFYQVNTKGAEQLYSVASRFAEIKKTDILLDMYCGMGTIGLAMAKDCKQLVGVEIIPQAIDAANQSANQMGLDNASFIVGDASIAASKLLAQGLRPNIVILDPPRKGCDISTLNSIIKMNPEKIIMVSCNPTTAARDTAILAENGYSPKKIQPVDMFPRTKHVECVVLMSRK